MTARLRTNTDVIEDLARRAAAPVELVKDLYDDEVTKLKTDAASCLRCGSVNVSREPKPISEINRSLVPSFRYFTDNSH
jgi:hypothetical protein